MKLVKTREGKINLYIPNPKKYKLDSKMPVFFNPEMGTNRDVSIILLRATRRKLKCLDLFTGTGIRGLRIKAEVPGSEVTLNDANPSAIKLIEKNAKLNKLKLEVSYHSANKFLKESKKKWDYIDIDPFGTPAPFLEAAVGNLSKDGLLGITATDTSALCGTYPSACKRKYNSKSLRCPMMHELGLRILINATQEVAEKQGINLCPIFVHSTRHYMRIYLKKVSKKQSNRGYFKYNFRTGEFSTTKRKPRKDYAGPLWLGPLWDAKLVNKMLDDMHLPILDKISNESKIQTVGFYDIHSLAKIYHLEQLPKLRNVMESLLKQDFKVERTHFTPTGIKTDAKLKDVLKILKK